MNIVCCIKQVPDTAQVRIDPETNTLMRAGVESICNPYDLVAAECAVKIAHESKGRVTVITMGIPQAESALRECLALGADDAVLLSDRAFAGADTLATSAALSAAISRISESDPVSLVICGKQAVDGDTAQTGPGIASRLGYTLLTNVISIEKTDSSKNTMTVRRETGAGSEIIESKLPALITVELNCVEPHYPSLPELVASVRKEIPVWTAEMLNVAPGKIGLKGSPTSVKTIFAPPQRKGGPVFDCSESGAAESVRSLLKKLLKDEPGIVELAANGGKSNA